MAKILRHLFFYSAGLIVLAMVKLKHSLAGYTTPKPFGTDNFERCFKYDLEVVRNWLNYLNEYVLTDNFLLGKNVLELGPGSDLGAGLLLLAKGAATYSACDVHDLVKSVPEGFYPAFFDYLLAVDKSMDTGFLKRELMLLKHGKPEKLNYLCRKDFDLGASFKEASFDIVFSQAAFEHFDNVEKTFQGLMRVCKPGAVLIAEIDLATHSRWIRQNDPNNIYRFGRRVYSLFRFPGVPNRLRPYQYEKMLQDCGWQEIKIIPITKINDSAVSKMNALLDRDFQKPENHMEYLSVILCARKK